ncbi:acyl-CoA synthetase (AMP-forming)/AMP-acid ligase II [Nocardioides daedukensis]|uniref:Acyl-CoA synthetase (AMP-forming)/AMP-acid ligase II n=1 Tax=Nocardioides daedukensis TaxID=634462 RepID=A0A7Y9S2D3_9ACTN|nr:class I adenylate-forming enzyme family protein [Nocardioides daedukensis]NYG59734.1 acyl-CoA synthetase (AMP-forming)/AMP-acid ligase II [Nocardioides daedukensis]
MIELVRQVAETDPTRVAVLTHETSMTYAELLASAEQVAAGLEPRSRLAVVDAEATTLLPLLLGACEVRVELCQYPPEASPGEVAELAERFDHPTVLTPTSTRQLLTDSAGAGASTTDGSAGVGASTSAGSAGRPHLVLTTGTSGAPKGVRHDWDRLVRSVRRVSEAEDAPGQRWLLAYGLHQFAGLQILLHVFAAGATLVAPAPRRPQEGLRAMRELGVTHVSATPTWWRFLLAEMRADKGPIPELEQITLGGEAIPAPLLAQLTKAFPSATISQVYAASEFGSTGSQRDGRAGLAASVLERDETADVQMKVVDGELWVRSRIGMLGYHGDEPIDPDAWRATGDLVEIEGDRIVFRGRSSEIINVGGVKVHPLPIEERVGAVDGVDVARVFGRANAMTGAIVAVEVVAAPGADTAQLKDAIRESCKDLPAAARPRSIKFVDAISTAGNKIIRRAP